jgi:hypothetical protein
MDEHRSTEWKRIKGRFRRIAVTELGDEQLCSSCGQLWPLDKEFFAAARSGIGYECKACVRERQCTGRDG